MQSSTINSSGPLITDPDGDGGWYEYIVRHVPCDRAAYGLIEISQPQADAILGVHGWSDQAMLAWCRHGFEDDELLHAARRHTVATAPGEELTQPQVLPVDGHALTCMLPESLPQQSWWWCQLSRRDRPFTAVEREALPLVMRQLQFQFDYIAPPGLGRLVLGHDGRVIHADPATALLLLAKPLLLGQLIETLHIVVAQRWPEANLSDEHDFAIELQGVRYWIYFRRGAAIAGATAWRWHLELRPLAEGELPPLGSIDSPQIAQALAFLHEHYRESPSLTRVAQAIDFSPFHFHRQFKSIVGVSPKRYLQQKQLQVAKWLLRSGSTPVGTIAQRTGFSSHGLFTATFQRLTGMSPSEYRESG
jgi:AraC-like DNA-binding protein